MENWQRVREIFVGAVRQKPELRSRFLDRACGTDAELRREVESLLASHDDTDGFLEDSPLGDFESVNQTKRLPKAARFAHYEILRQIGAGGMGEVFLAQDTKLDRRVAVKILNEKFAAHESNLRRFVQEAKSASALNHPNILVIHEIGASENVHYIVSEYVEGETLREKIAKKNLNLPEILEIAVQLANALSAAHAAKIIHRDIKPENIVIRPDGLVKILDFGLAKLAAQTAFETETLSASQNQTAKGIILGTVNYMSPEQAKGEPVDERTDIFSFGIVLYEMLTGRTPFAAETMPETFANLLHREPPPLPPPASDELRRVAAKLLQKNKNERYETIEKPLADLKALKKQIEFSDEFGRERQTAKTLAAVAVPASNAIAVLPFANGSDDEDLNYLSDGLSESVIDRLSQLPQLKVIARSSSFKYRGENLDLTDVAKKLRVRLIVTGRVVPRGESLSIRVEMIDAFDNRQLWSEQFDRPKQDAPAAQREIAQTVSEKLKLKLSGTQARQLASQGTSNAEAYDLLLRGEFFVNKGGIENKKKAVEYYCRAIAIDPEYALAHARLSAVYRNLIGFSVLDPKEFAPQARAATERALELDEALGDAHLQLANSYLDEWNWTAAETEYKRAIELNPNLIDARRKYAAFLTIVGRYAEALAEAQTVAELDPLTLYTRLTVPYVLVSARRYEEAVAEFEKLLELDPNFSGTHLFLGNAYAGKAMFREAVGAFHEAIRCGEQGPSVQIYLGAAHAGAGEREKASEILNQLESGSGYVPPGELAILYVALGEREKAFAALEKAYDARDLHLQYLRVEPGFDALRDDPRFQDLLRRIGFPADETTVNEDEIVPLIFKMSADPAEGKPVKSTEPKNPSYRKRFFMFGLIIFSLAAIVFGYYFFVKPAQTTKQVETTADTVSKSPPILYRQMPDAEQLNFISERAAHIQTLIGDAPVELDENALRLIKTEIDDYVAERDSLSQKPFEEGLRVVYGRASQYAPVIIRAYEARKVAPALGLYQAMVESEYHDCYTSRIGSVGLFQFKPSTAREYGLLPKDFCNVERQSDAAAHYMSDLSSDFVSGGSSATLGLLGFVLGETQVREYLRQLRARGVEERSFWTILRFQNDLQPPLPDDGKQYVPRFFAAAIIGETPDAFELSTPPLTTLRN